MPTWKKLALVGSSQTFSGTQTIDETTNHGLVISSLANYKGIELNAVGSSRPAIYFKNANQSTLGSIYGTEGNEIEIYSTLGVDVNIGNTTGGTRLFDIKNSTGLMFSVLNIGNNSTNAGIRSGGSLTVQTNAGTTALTLDTSQNATFAGSIIGDSTNFDIYQTSSDASDNRRTRIGGGGDVSQSRGAYIELAGNEHSNTGQLILNAGDVSGGDIIFKTDNTTRLTIDDTTGSSTFSGRLIAGTSTASELFGVKGSVDDEWGARIENTHSGGYGSLIKVAGTTSNELVFQARASSTNILTVLGNSTVGIGTATPLHPIHVEKSLDSEWIAKFKNTGTTNAYGVQIDTTANTGAGEYALGVYTGSNLGFFVTSDAKVGIGTTSPDYPLHVHGSSDGVGYIKISDSNTDQGDLDGARIGFNSGVMRIQNFENSDMEFYVNNTTKPLILESDGNATFSGQLRIPDGSVSEPSIVFTSDDDGGGTGIYRGGANNIRMSINGTKAFELDASRNLHMDGNITLTGGQLKTTSGVNLALNPNTGLVTVGGSIQASSSSNVYLSLDTTQTNGDEWKIFNVVSGSDSQLQFKNEDATEYPLVLQEGGLVGINKFSGMSKTLHVDSTTGSAGTPNGIMLHNYIHGSDSQIYMYAENDSGTASSGIIKYDPDASTMTVGGSNGTGMSINSSGHATFAGTVQAKTGSKITSSSADTTFSIETTSGTTIFPVLDLVSSHSSVGGKIRQGGSDVISFDKSQNATFAGHVILPNTYALQWGDSGARIEGNTSTDTVTILTGGTSALTINSSQNATFAGGITVTSESDSKAGFRLYSGSTLLGGIYNSSGKVHLRGEGDRDVSIGSSNNPDRVIIDTSSGNVGIGATPSSYKLEVSGGDVSFAKSVSAGSGINNLLTLSATDGGVNMSGGEGAGILFKIPDDETNPSIGGQIGAIKESADDSISSTALVFSTSQNDETLDEAMRIDSSGRVGIGRSPVSWVHIDQTGAGTERGLYVYRDLASGVTDGELVFINNDNTGDDQPALRVKQDGTGDILVLDDGATRALTVADGGNVGIGCTDPQQPLTVDVGSYRIHTQMISGEPGIFATDDSNSATDLVLKGYKAKLFGATGTGLVIDNSANATFAGDVTVEKASADTTFKVSRSDQTNIQLVSAGRSYVRASAELALQSNGANTALTLDTSQNATFTGNATATNFIATTAVYSNSGVYYGSSTTLYLKDSGGNEYGNWDANKKFTNVGDIQAPGIYVGSTNTSYDFYNNGTTYLNGATTIDAETTISGQDWNTSLTIKGGGANSGIKFLDSDNNVDGYIYASGGVIALMDSGGDGMIEAANDSYIRFRTNGGTEHMRITSDGKVGIGTTSPTSPLHVKSSATDTAGILLEAASGGELLFRAYESSAGHGQLYMQPNGGGSTVKIDTNGDSYFNGGKVGIGTSSPDAGSGAIKLHIQSGSAGSVSAYDGDSIGLCIEASGNSGMQFLTGSNSDTRIWFGDANTTTSGAIIYTHHATATSENMDLRVNSSTRMRIMGDGSIGFGTTSPDADYHFAQGTHNRVLISSNGPTLVFKEDNTTNENWAFYHNAGVMNLMTMDDSYGSSSTKVSFLQNGNVGIGTSSPAAPLHIVGATMLLADGEADNATKQGRIGSEHYDVDEEPFYYLYSIIQSGNNQINIGGGTSSGNAATNIKFYTAANSSTTTGTERLAIESDGDIVINGRIKMNTSGQFYWGDAYNQGYLNWTTNKVIMGGLGSNALDIVTNNTTALAIDTSQNATFSGAYLNINAGGTNSAITTNSDTMQFIADTNDNGGENPFEWWHNSASIDGGTKLMHITNDKDLWVANDLTTAGSISVADGQKVGAGDSTDIWMTHSTHSYIENKTGEMRIVQGSGDHFSIWLDNGSGSDVKRFAIAPDGKTHVGGGAAAGQFNVFNNTSDSKKSIVIDTGTSYQSWSIGYEDVSNRLNLVIQKEYGDGSWGNALKIMNDGGQLQGTGGSAAKPTYSFIDQASTGMYKPGTSQLYFSVAGTRKVRMEASQIVLEDDVSIDNTLTVSGTTISLGGTSSVDSYLRFDGSSGDTYLHYNANDMIDVYTGGDIAMRIKDDDVEFNGAISTSGRIEGKYLVTFIHNFSDDIGTTEHAIPWAGTGEQTNANASQVAYMAPFAMTLKKIILRPETITNAAATFKIFLKKQDDGDTTDDTVATQTSAGSHNNNTAFTLSEAGFSATPSVGALDKVSLHIKASVDPSSTIDWYITSVWEVTQEL